MAAQVDAAGNLGKALFSQQGAHRRCLIITMLQQQPAAWQQVLRRLGNDQALQLNATPLSIADIFQKQMTASLRAWVPAWAVAAA